MAQKPSNSMLKVPSAFFGAIYSIYKGGYSLPERNSTERHEKNATKRFTVCHILRIHHSL